MTILEDIIAYKKDEVIAAKNTISFAALSTIAAKASPVRPFQSALVEAAKTGVALIAEIKKASPSKGLIRADFNPAHHARAYQAGGAACLSVLTDKPSFQGAPRDLEDARAACSLPVLRKDFMIDPYQVAQARAWGADCILLIMACLSADHATDLFAAAQHFGLAAIFEVHDERDLDQALTLGAPMVGINNRNLKTFETDLGTTSRLAADVPTGTLAIAESGLRTPKDLAFLRAAGASAFLVGESLMRQPDVELATKTLINRG